jgi:hypothetical protein
VKATLADIKAIPANSRYIGLKVYSIADEAEYIFQTGITDGDLVVYSSGDGAPATAGCVDILSSATLSTTFNTASTALLSTLASTPAIHDHVYDIKGTIALVTAVTATEYTYIPWTTASDANAVKYYDIAGGDFSIENPANVLNGDDTEEFLGLDIPADTVHGLPRIEYPDAHVWAQQSQFLDGVWSTKVKQDFGDTQVDTVLRSIRRPYIRMAKPLTDGTYDPSQFIEDKLAFVSDADPRVKVINDATGNVLIDLTNTDVVYVLCTNDISVAFTGTVVAGKQITVLFNKHLYTASYDGPGGTIALEVPDTLDTTPTTPQLLTCLYLSGTLYATNLVTF